MWRLRLCCSLLIPTWVHGWHIIHGREGGREERGKKGRREGTKEREERRKEREGKKEGEKSEFSGKEHGGRRGGSPLIEGCGALLGHHLQHTVQGAAVSAWRGVHVPGLHHIHGGGHDRGTEAGPKGRDKVAGEVVCSGEGRRKH